MENKISKKVVIAITIFVLMFLNVLLENISIVSAVNGEETNISAIEEAIEVQIEQSIDKYFKVDEEQTLLQQKLSVKTNKDNEIKETENVEIQVPVIQNIKPELAIVLVNGNRLNDDAYTYDSTEGKLNILLSNGNQSVDFGKTEDVYKVIYGYKQIEIKETEQINILAKVTTKFENRDEIVVQDTKEIELKEIGNDVSIKGYITKEVYKGYMYEAKENVTSYNTRYVIEVSNMKNVEDINITNENAQYTYYEKQINGNTQEEVNQRVLNPAIDTTYFKSTRLKKQDMIRLLGEDGKITIKNDKDEIISEITKDTQDDNGNIIVQYEGDLLNKIKITTTKPIFEGTLQIDNIKEIKANTGYERKILEKFEYLEETIKVNENINMIQMKLLNPETNASIKLSNEKLSTLEKNTNVEIVVNLKTNDNMYDLYKNPKIEIVLPDVIDELEIKSINKLYDDTLTIKEAKLVTVDNKKVIVLSLEGEQTIYNKSISEGAQIVLNSDITLKKDVPTSKSEVVMNYINENGDSQVKQAQTEFEIVSKYGMMMYTKVSGYDDSEGKASIDNSIITANLDIQSGIKTAKVERTVINNYEENISGVVVTGEFSGIGEKVNDTSIEASYDITLAKAIQVNIPEAKIYYSETKNTDNQSSEWKETIEDFSKVKAYKVEIPNSTLEVAKTLKLNYELNIPEGLGYLESSFENVNVEYIYKEQEVLDSYYIQFNTQVKESSDNQSQLQLTNSGNVRTSGVQNLGQVNIQAISGGKELSEGDEIYEGQTIKYIVTIINDTPETIENLSVVAKHTNAIFLDKEVKQETDTYTGGMMDVTRIVENEALTEKKFDKDSLGVGESISFEYEFVVKEKTGEQTSGVITINANSEEKNINTITNNIKDAKLKLTARYAFNEEVEISSGGVFNVSLTTKNISNQTIEDIILEIEVPENASFRYGELTKSEEYELLEYDENIVKIKINRLDIEKELVIYISFQVQSLSIDILQTSISTMYNVNLGNEKYTSNEVSKVVYQVNTDITINQVGSIESEYVKTGDELIFTTKIKNVGFVDASFLLTDDVPDVATVQEAYITKNGLQEKIDNIIGNYIFKQIYLEPGEEIDFVVHTIIDEQKALQDIITNKVYLSSAIIEKESNEVSYKLQEVYTDISSISGTVWIDQNEDGQRQQEEEKINDMQVILVNPEDGKIAKNKSGNDLETRTDNEGRYNFSELNDGKYIAIFYYDTETYSVTEYKKENVGEFFNSDVVSKEFEGQKVAMTDDIEILEEGRTIDAGFVENKIFDLKLDKYVNKIVLQNNSEVRTTQYNKAQLAKIEVDAKKMGSSVVTVDYEICITNEGEIPGYVNEIVDYLPDEMEFNAQLNKDWTVIDNNKVQNISLSNELIEPGETKTVILTLTKSLTEDNIGTIINTAEIGRSTNSKVIDDIDSIGGNTRQDEDDMSSAELIISIRTGIGITISIIIAIAILSLITFKIYDIKRKEKKVNE